MTSARKHVLIDCDSVSLYVLIDCDSVSVYVHLVGFLFTLKLKISNGELRVWLKSILVVAASDYVYKCLLLFLIYYGSRCCVLACVRVNRYTDKLVCELPDDKESYTPKRVGVMKKTNCVSIVSVFSWFCK